MYKRKNILYITHAYRSFEKDQIELLAKNFNKVYVLVRHNPLIKLNKILRIEFLKKYQLDKKINKYNLPKNIRIYPTSVPYLPTNFFYNFLGDLHFILTDKIIRKNKIKFDLIHSHFTWTAGYVGAKLKEKYKKPFILTIHENPNWFEEEIKSNNPKIRWTWKMANQIIRVDKNSVTRIQSINKNCIYIPNGYNPKYFFPLKQNKIREKMKLPRNKKIILNIGDLEVIKGQKYLIKAVNKIVKTKQNLLCLIIGEGIQRNKLQRLIKIYNLSKYVKLIGLIPHEKINIWINSCDLFVFPSLKESFGIAQIEALACGKPVVATKNGGSNQIINKDNGYLIPIKNSNEIEKKVLKALKIQWYPKQIINDVNKKYNLLNICKQISLVYSKYSKMDKIISLKRAIIV